MREPAGKEVSERILVHAPFGCDGKLIKRILAGAGLSPYLCPSLKDLCGRIEGGAGAALISDHAFGRNDVSVLAKTLSNQPPWSALPVLVMTSGGASTSETRSVLRKLEPLGNLTLLERPLRPDTLVTTVQAAMRSRRQQYQICDYIRRLEEHENTLKTYLDNTGDGVYIVDHQTGRILDFNQRAVERLGYTRDELLRLCLSDIFVERAPVAAAIRAFSRRKARRTVQLEGTKRRKNGSTFPVEVRMTSLEPTLSAQVLVVMHDIAERKRVEQERAEEARRKDEFLALLGHELRNPLAAISTSLEVVCGEAPPAQRQELHRTAARQVALMRRLLDDLLDLNRIARGQMRLKKESINLAEFLKKVASASGSNFAERRQDLALRLPLNRVEFIADRVRLAQVTANLLGNASKYSPPGAKIEFSGAREGSAIVLRCRDNGQGISPEFVERLFEPFSRGNNLYNRYGDASLGIGLALVKQIVELHGGTISVKSGGEGLGSEFTVRLPLVKPPSRRAIAAEPKSTPATEGARSIVIVEDNPVVATSMKLALEQAGHRVHIFPDGARALAGAAGLTPDAIVLDIGLPDMDGYALAAQLKKKRNLKSALFIALSGFAHRSQAEKKADHFDHYFIKPVDMKTLLTSLGKHSRNGPESEPGKKPPKPEMPESSGRPRVLLVEDHPFVADATAALLRMEELEVRTALSGREALEVAPDFRPQLILCDMRLGDMKGTEVIRQLRLNPATKQAHAVIVTAFSESEIEEFNQQAKEFGVNEFISKPVDPDMIQRLVSTLRPH